MEVARQAETIDGTAGLNILHIRLVRGTYQTRTIATYVRTAEEEQRIKFVRPATEEHAELERDSHAVHSEPPLVIYAPLEKYAGRASGAVLRQSELGRRDEADWTVHELHACYHTPQSTVKTHLQKVGFRGPRRAVQQTEGL